MQTKDCSCLLTQQQIYHLQLYASAAEKILFRHAKPVKLSDSLQDSEIKPDWGGGGSLHACQ